MADLDILRKLEGLQTLQGATEKLEITRQGTLNLLSRLKKEGYVTTSGGGRKIRLYKITMRKQLARDPGMFDIINKYSPNFQVNEWFDHQVHGKYGPEEALIDAIKTKSFRLILASLRLFGHIKDWRRLHRLAKENDLVQEVGALYDVARLNLRTRKIPALPLEYSPRQRNLLLRDSPANAADKKSVSLKWRQLTQLKERNNFPEIEKRWKVYIPFNEKDLEEIK
jgi:hypothetical protein